MKTEDKIFIGAAIVAGLYLVRSYSQVLNIATETGTAIANSDTVQSIINSASGLNAATVNLTTPATTPQLQVAKAFRDAQYAAAANGTVAPISFYVPGPLDTVLHPESYIIWPADSGLNASMPM